MATSLSELQKYAEQHLGYDGKTQASFAGSLAKLYAAHGETLPVNGSNRVDINKVLAEPNLGSMMKAWVEYRPQLEVGSNLIGDVQSALNLRPNQYVKNDAKPHDNIPGHNTTTAAAFLYSQFPMLNEKNPGTMPQRHDHSIDWQQVLKDAERVNVARKTGKEAELLAELAVKPIPAQDTPKPAVAMVEKPVAVEKPSSVVDAPKPIIATVEKPSVPQATETGKPLLGDVLPKSATTFVPEKPAKDNLFNATGPSPANTPKPTKTEGLVAKPTLGRNEVINVPVEPPAKPAPTVQAAVESDVASRVTIIREGTNPDLKIKTPELLASPSELDHKQNAAQLAAMVDPNKVPQAKRKGLLGRLGDNIAHGVDNVLHESAEFAGNLFHKKKAAEVKTEAPATETPVATNAAPETTKNVLKGDRRSKDGMLTGAYGEARYPLVNVLDEKGNVKLDKDGKPEQVRFNPILQQPLTDQPTKAGEVLQDISQRLLNGVVRIGRTAGRTIESTGLVDLDGDGKKSGKSFGRDEGHVLNEKNAGKYQVDVEATLKDQEAHPEKNLSTLLPHLPKNGVFKNLQQNVQEVKQAIGNKTVTPVQQADTTKGIGTP